SLLSVPAGSAAALSDRHAVRPTFVADKPGTYTAQLIVNDGTVDSMPAAVLVSTMNSAPVANAGPDQTVAVGSVVTLDGGQSSDVDGDMLTYQWAFTSVPSGSTAKISAPASVNPTFIADRHGTYTLQLIVSDDQVASDPDFVVISTSNSKPVAQAGADQTVDVNSRVTLDGHGSFDADQ